MFHLPLLSRWEGGFGFHSPCPDSDSEQQRPGTCFQKCGDESCLKCTTRRGGKLGKLYLGAVVPRGVHLVNIYTICKTEEVESKQTDCKNITVKIEETKAGRGPYFKETDVTDILTGAEWSVDNWAIDERLHASLHTSLGTGIPLHLTSLEYFQCGAGRT